jgi:hypothetical protein
MSKSKIFFQDEFRKASFGANGVNEIDNGGATVTINAEDRFFALIAKGDTVFAFENDADKGIKSSSAFTLDDGDVFYGYFHSLVVASGKLRVYYGN